MTDAEHYAHEPAPAEPAPELLVGGSAAYACMWRLLRQARTAVELETYIYEAGAVGDRFLDELTNAARRGVHVRVLVDAYGSDTLRRDYFAPLIAAGGELRWFNPQRFLRRSFRNHRKLLRADGEAVIGGLNIADAYDGDGLESGWRDFAVRVDGPVVDALAASFARMWDLSAFGRREFRRFWRTAPQPAAGAVKQPELLLSGPGCPTAELRRRLLFDIRAARRMQAWAAYFLPSRRIGAAIRDAARRGDADIIVGERSDVPVSQWASERLFKRFLRAGLRIHCYRPQIVHAKALLLDDIVYVGSSNLDVRSLLINYELLLRLPSAALAARLRAEFEADRRHTDTLDPVRWRHGRRWWQSLRSYLAYQLLARLDPYVATRSLRSLR
ncbi:MAG: phosphatidylserine/phosphatidylglycerophosphate/cardiolipin synthase family protein [Gammaproteobacteria bacterium]|nr:phosphatidylserine/phosphatidylglycerophosphate/cardiolipin synthase family protein [Gammaproteobacteria bacterium]MDH5273224.1 phosphatidylserine/phosphatidylglycerophosphate/cardiolipin synthase family protein [Gammaproteobacteria bacterium]